jgi:cytochrome c-type biogenesis protein
MLPILLGASVGQKRRRRPLFVVLGFTLTFSTVALVFGLFPEVLGLAAKMLRDAAIALLLVFGLTMDLAAPVRLARRPAEWAREPRRCGGAKRAGRHPAARHPISRRPGQSLLHMAGLSQ